MKYSQPCVQRSTMGNYKKMPLFTGGLYSERQKLSIRFSRDKFIRLVFVDRKLLLAGVRMHRFDCISKTSNPTTNPITTMLDYRHTLATTTALYSIVYKDGSETMPYR